MRSDAWHGVWCGIDAAGQAGAGGAGGAHLKGTEDGGGRKGSDSERVIARARCTQIEVTSEHNVLRFGRQGVLQAAGVANASRTVPGRPGRCSGAPRTDDARN
jgi:hypothetical protein